MTVSDRERWNAKYRAGGAGSEEPDSLLAEICSDLAPGRALDLAGGAGRHAVWLARRGWRVLLTDISEEGLAIASARAAQAAVTLEIRREAMEETLESARRSQDRFDLIAVFWFLMREQFAVLPGLLAPGGLLLYKTFTREHPRFSDGASTQFALEPGELRNAFPELETVLYRDAAGVAEVASRAR